MAEIYTVPIARGVPHQTQTTTLDGRSYRLNLNWNQRIERWFFDLETANGDPIVRCKALVLGADLLRLVRWNPAAPPGGLVLVDMQGRGAEADLDTLGDRVRLLYMSRD